MGLDLGLEQAGIRTTMAVEIDRWCCETIRANRPKLTLLSEDVTTLDAAALRKARRFKGDVALMIGGPPCQSFSPGGKRAGLSDPRGNLIYEYLRLISEVRPRFFVLENVANLVTAALNHRPIRDRPGQHWSLKSYEGNRYANHDDGAPMQPDELSGSAIRQILRDVSRLGYRVKFGVVDAADFGAAQHRLRFIVFGGRDVEPPSLPTPTHGQSRPGLHRHVTLRDAIADLQRSPGPGSEYGPEMSRFFELVREGGHWRDLPPSLQREALGASYDAGGGKTGFFRRLAWDRPAPTITGKANRKGSAVCHPAQTRPLSVRECARIQGFPDSWKIVGATNQQYQQIGNAVPVALGYAIGKAFAPVLARRKPKGRKTAATDYRHDYEPMLQAAVARLRLSARNKRSQDSDVLPLFEASGAV